MLYVINYSTLINGLCKLGRMEVARELFDDMLKIGFSQNYVTYITLVHEYMKENNMQKIYKIYDELFSKGEIRNAGKLISMGMESKGY